MEPPFWEQCLRLTAALIGSGVIGWERETRDRAAGLRTHMLVGLGSCVFTLLALDFHFASAAAPDPLRVISGIVGGIGFLGAGAIIQSRGKVRGLTTAAGIWVVAAIGVASGCGNYGLVAVAVGMAFLTLFALGKIEHHTAVGASAEPPASPDE